MARYTEQNADVRTIPAEEIWVGIIDSPNPYIAIVSRLDGDGNNDLPVLVCRFDSTQARGMAEQLVHYATSIEARTPNQLRHAGGVQPVL